MLLAPLDLRADAAAREQQVEAGGDLHDPVAARSFGAGLQLLQALGDRFVGVGLELRERQRLHLAHELVHADALGERRVDVERLARDPPPLVRLGDVMQRAHVVQPVGEFDQQHPDIVRHGEQELAQVLGRTLALRLSLDLGKLGDPIDQPRDLRPEDTRDLLGGRDRVLDGVVEDRGRYRLVIEV